MQNWEKSSRGHYVPDLGKIFVQSDQSGAEALVVAYLTRNGNYRALFKHGIKPHTYICTHIFKDVWPRKLKEAGLITDLSELDMGIITNTPIPLLKKQPLWSALDSTIRDSDNWSLSERYYYLGKQTEHSSNYDIHAPTFRMNILEKSGGKIVISKEDSEFYLETKHRLYPEIREDFHMYVRSNVERAKVLYNLHGHPYQITQAYVKESDWKEYYAWIPQSTVAEITRIAFTKMYYYILENNLDWDLLADTHDSYLLQCPIDEVLDCGRKSNEFLCQSFVSPIDNEPFTMRAETSAGFNWRPFHKDKNPQGLREIKL
jgi:hypothetical protein